MFQIDPDVGLLVVTDTLSTGAERSPHMFVTKCYPVPHLRIVMAGTGTAQIIDRWAHALNNSMLAVGFDMVAQHAAAALRGIEAAVEAEFPGEVLSTTTVYHFGPDENGKWVWYAFRSRNRFVAERHDQGVHAAKPEPADPLHESDFDSFATMVDLGKRIRSEQDARPDGVGIGGELWCTVFKLDEGDPVFLQRPIYQWDDMGDHWLAMNSKLAGLESNDGIG